MAEGGRIGVVARTFLAIAAFACTSLAGVLPLGGAPSSCASADSSLRIGIVIDFGILAGTQGAPSTPAVRCTSVRDGANGFDVLDASGHTYRQRNGLLCAIDGFPTGTECGDSVPGGYRYWAYFHGSSAGWTYSGQGAGNVALHTTEVEGWHFVEGKGNPTDPPPNGPSDPAQVCPTAPPPPPPTVPSTHVTAPPTTAPAPTVPGAPPTTVAPPGGAPGASTVPSSTPAPGAPGSSDAAGPAVDGPDQGGGPAGTAPDGNLTGPDGATDGTAVVPADANPAAGAASADRSSEVASAAVTTTAAGSSTSPLAAIAVLAVIVLVAGGAVLRFRAADEGA